MRPIDTSYNDILMDTGGWVARVRGLGGKKAPCVVFAGGDDGNEFPGTVSLDWDAYKDMGKPKCLFVSAEGK